MDYEEAFYTTMDLESPDHFDPALPLCEEPEQLEQSTAALFSLPDEDFIRLCEDCQRMMSSGSGSFDSVSSGSGSFDSVLPPRIFDSPIPISSSPNTYTPISTPSPGCSGSFSTEDPAPKMDGQPVQAEPQHKDASHMVAANGRLSCPLTRIDKRPRPSFRCKPHDKTFTSKGSLDRHQDSFKCGPGTGKRFVCKECEEIFTRTDKFKDHLARKHSQGAGPARRGTASSAASN